jgi:hypothetical protein
VTMNEIIERLTKSIERSERNPATWPRVVFEDAEVILDALKAGQALADAVWAWHAVYEQAPEHKDATWLNELMAAREDIWAALAAYPEVNRER